MSQIGTILGEIKIDPRSGSGDLIDHPALRHWSHHQLLVEDGRQLGDVLIPWTDDDGRARRSIVELKSFADFLSGLPRHTSRLCRQVTDVIGRDCDEAPLADEYWLAVYGTWRRGVDGSLLVPVEDCPYPSHDIYRVDGIRMTPHCTVKGRPSMSYAEVESAFLTLSRAGVQRAPHLPTKDDAATWIALLARHLMKPPSKHQTLRTLPRRGIRYFLPPSVDPVTRRMVAVASDLLEGVGGGIGPKTAREVARKFRSVHEMANANPEEWLIPKLIGGPTAQRVFDAIRKEREQ